MSQFRTGILTGKLPGDGAVCAIALNLQSIDAPSQGSHTVGTTRQTATLKNADLDFSHIQPLPWGQCLHHAKANKCPYGQNACFTKDNGPCHKIVTTPEHAPVIIATMEDLKRSKRIADEQRWEMYANDLADQINGMQQVLDELQLPADRRSRNRGGMK